MPTLLVLAGASGAGKTSLGGALLRSRGMDFYSAEDYARDLIDTRRCALDDAIEAGWIEGKRRMERSIADGEPFAIETTLGGRTMAGLVRHAASCGFDVHVWFFGLSSADQHVISVARRVSAGGFPVPERLIRDRFDRSRENLIALMLHIANLRVFDNSTDRECGSIETPAPRLVLKLERGQWRAPAPAHLSSTPGWAKPLLEAASNGSACRRANARW